MKFRDTMTSYSQSTLKIDGVEYSIKTRSYGDNVEFMDVDGSSAVSVGRTRGQYKTDEVTVEMYVDDYADLIEKFGEEFFMKSFMVTNTYSVDGDSKLTQDELVRCRFTKRAASDSAGADALTRTLSLKPLIIRWNGKNPLPADQMPKGI